MMYTSAWLHANASLIWSINAEILQQQEYFLSVKLESESRFSAIDTKQKLSSSSSGGSTSDANFWLNLGCFHSNMSTFISSQLLNKVTTIPAL